ncbi:unnamed protein product [Malus baccata var. baccata]
MESHLKTCYLRVEDELETNKIVRKQHQLKELTIRTDIRRNAAVEVVYGDVHPSELRVPPQAPGKRFQRRKLCNSVGNFAAHLVVEKTEESKVFQLLKGFWDPPRNQIVGKIQALESSDVAELRRN